MIFLYLVLSLDKTIGGINSILPIVSYRNKFHTRDIPTGDVPHLWRQLLTGDARRIPMARLYEYCLPCETSLV